MQLNSKKILDCEFFMLISLVFIYNADWFMGVQGTQKINPMTGGQLLENLESKIRKAHAELAKSVDNYSEDYSKYLQNREEFDFIIIGAGSAGSVVANRISSNKDWRVLLIEAGGNPTLLSEIPAMYSAFQGTEADWNYQTAQDGRTCLGLEKQQCAMPKGKILGGTSSINGMFYVRGNRKDYDTWEKLGNSGWNYTEVLRYFKKSENLENPYIKDDRDLMKYHGTHGYLSVDSFNSTPHYLSNYYFKAVEELGYKLLPCINGDTQTGFSFLSATVSKGKRCSTAKAFLEPIRKRENLKISKNSVAMKVLIRKKSKRAFGVELVTQGNKTIRVHSKKEIILSAGTFGSAQLLMLSGIGPKLQLTELGIEVVQDLEVGKNMQDHIAIPIVVAYNEPQKNMVDNQDSADSYYQFLTKSTGPLTNLGFNSFTGFIGTNDTEDYPEIQIHHFTFSKNNKKGISTFLDGYGFLQETKNSVVAINADSDVTLIIPALLRPKSRGQVLLRNKNPLSKPIIMSGFLNETDDVSKMLDAIKFVQKFVKTKSLSEIKAEIKQITVEGCLKENFQSDEYWKCMLQHIASSLYHTVGTCKMGLKNDSSAVVDSNLKVHGIDGLRVVDASVMPTIVSGNTNAVVIMIGEKAAHLILQHWQNRNPKGSEDA